MDKMYLVQIEDWTDGVWVTREDAEKSAARLNAAFIKEQGWSLAKVVEVEVGR